MYTRICQGYEIFFYYPFDQYGVRVMGKTSFVNTIFFNDLDSCRSYIAKNPILGKIMHDECLLTDMDDWKRADYFVWLKEKEHVRMKCTVVAPTTKELIDKIAFFLGITQTYPE